MKTLKYSYFKCKMIANLRLNLIAIVTLSRTNSRSLIPPFTIMSIFKHTLQF